jgi:hypothetical protein|tara:strand:- start:51 stop:1544 length:1494 start_codon:yes stop_codon:yes gene_type:complete
MLRFKEYINEASIYDSKYPRSSEFTLNARTPQNAVHKAIINGLGYPSGTTFKKSDEEPTSEKNIAGEQKGKNVSVTLEDDKGNIVQVWGTKSAFQGAFNKGNSKGGGKMQAADWEEVITIAHNQSLEPTTGLDEAAKMGEISLPVKPKIASKVTIGLGSDILKGIKLPSDPMIHFGRKTGSPSSTWIKTFKDAGIKMNSKTMTPKTDMKVGSWNISLKQSGGSQLMSGYKGDTMGVIMAAYDKSMKEDKSEMMQELSTLKTDFDKMYGDVQSNFAKSQDVGQGSRAIRKKVKSGETLNAIETAVMDVIQKGTIVQNTISGIFERSPRVKYYAVEESMTGNMKFSDDPPKANYLMVFSPSGTGTHIDKIDKKIIDGYASKVSWNVGMKSAGGKGALSLRAIVKDEYEPTLTMKQIISESWDEMGEDISYLTEGLWDKIKDKASSTVNWTKEKALKVLKSFWDKIVNKIIALLQRGFVWIKKIFGWQPVVTSISNPYFV